MDVGACVAGHKKTGPCRVPIGVIPGRRYTHIFAMGRGGKTAAANNQRSLIARRPLASCMLCGAGLAPCQGRPLGIETIWRNTRVQHVTECRPRELWAACLPVARCGVLRWHEGFHIDGIPRWNNRIIRLVCQRIVCCRMMPIGCWNHDDTRVANTAGRHALHSHRSFDANHVQAPFRRTRPVDGQDHTKMTTGRFYRVRPVNMWRGPAQSSHTCSSSISSWRDLPYPEPTISTYVA